MHLRPLYLNLPTMSRFHFHHHSLLLHSKNSTLLCQSHTNCCHNRSLDNGDGHQTTLVLVRRRCITKARQYMSMRNQATGQSSLLNLCAGSCHEEADENRFDSQRLVLLMIRRRCHRRLPLRQRSKQNDQSSALQCAMRQLQHLHIHIMIPRAAAKRMLIPRLRAVAQEKVAWKKSLDRAALHSPVKRALATKGPSASTRFNRT